MEEYVNLFLNNGTAIAVIIYFMWRDTKFMSRLDSTLTTIKTLLKMEEEKDDNDIN